MGESKAMDGCVASWHTKNKQDAACLTFSDIVVCSKRVGVTLLGDYFSLSRKKGTDYSLHITTCHSALTYLYINCHVNDKHPR